MRNLMAWAVLIAVFLAGGAGLNIFRLHIVAWLAYGRWRDALDMGWGLLLAMLATAFLGGFVYHRDKKRGKLKREGWTGRRVQSGSSKASRIVSSHNRD